MRNGWQNAQRKCKNSQGKGGRDDALMALQISATAATARVRKKRTVFLRSCVFVISTAGMKERRFKNRNRKKRKRIMTLELQLSIYTSTRPIIAPTSARAPAGTVASCSPFRLTQGSTMSSVETSIDPRLTPPPLP